MFTETPTQVPINLSYLLLSYFVMSTSVPLSAIATATEIGSSSSKENPNESSQQLIEPNQAQTDLPDSGNETASDANKHTENDELHETSPLSHKHDSAKTSNNILIWWKLCIIPASLLLSCLITIFYLFLADKVNMAAWYKAPAFILLGTDNSVHFLYKRFEYRKDMDMKGETHRTFLFAGFKQTVPMIYGLNGEEVVLDQVHDEIAKKNRVRFGLRKKFPRKFSIFLERNQSVQSPGTGTGTGTGTGGAMQMAVAGGSVNNNSGKRLRVQDEGVDIPYSPISWRVWSASTMETVTVDQKQVVSTVTDTAEVIRKIFVVYDWSADPSSAKPSIKK